MGNRAVITTKKAFEEGHGTGVYLHWNGGRDSVSAFLLYCKMHGYRAPEYDNYGWAYLSTVIGCFMGDGLSVGVDDIQCLDCNNWDNGVYLIEDWEIIGRKYFDGMEQDSHPLRDMLDAIDNRMPAHMQLGAEAIDNNLSRMEAEDDE